VSHFTRFSGGCFLILDRISAGNDTLWRAIQANPTPEIPFVVDGVPRIVLEAWTELSSDSPASFSTSFLASDLMFPQRLVKLRGIILARPFIDETKLVNAGRAQADEDKIRDALFLQSIRKKAKVAKKHAVAENARETRKAEEAARQNQDKVLEMQNELRLVTQKQGSLASTTTHKDSGDSMFTRRSNPAWQLPASKTALVNARVITSRSSKLNYLLKEARFSYLLSAIISHTHSLRF
jgi:hypothetical protein